MRYTLLNNVRSRRLFDPKNPEDLKELKHFVDTNQWIDGCPFYLEDQYVDVPTMCKDKYTRAMLQVGS